MRAARAFSPRPAPMTAPAAMAMTFLAPPPRPAPTGSSLPYRRKAGLASRAIRRARSAGSDAVMTEAAGSPAAISWAKLGPERIPAGTCGWRPARISRGRAEVPCSMPLAQTIMGAWGSRRAATARRCWTGTARRRASKPEPGRSVVISISGGRGRTRVLSRAQSVTRLPARRAWMASAEPQAPAPMTATLLISHAQDLRALAGLAVAEAGEEGGKDLLGGRLEAEGRVADEEAGAVEAGGIGGGAEPDFGGDDVAQGREADGFVEGGDRAAVLDGVPGRVDAVVEACGAVLEGGEDAVEFVGGFVGGVDEG